MGCRQDLHPSRDHAAEGADCSRIGPRSAWKNLAFGLSEPLVRIFRCGLCPSGHTASRWLTPALRRFTFASSRHRPPPALAPGTRLVARLLSVPKPAGGQAGRRRRQRLSLQADNYINRSSARRSAVGGATPRAARRAESLVGFWGRAAGACGLAGG